MNWQPIETAPRDGCLVLLFCEEDGNVYSCGWDGDGDYPTSSWQMWDGDEFHQLKSTPTHWQPMVDTPGGQA